MKITAPMARLHRSLFDPAAVTQGQRQLGFWVSLLFAAVYGLVAWTQAFAADYVIQDDARHYLFWMERFTRPGAFPEDLIADYLQSITPLGYKTLYRLAAAASISPELLAKLLPLGLGLIAAGYYYWLSLRILPLPLGACTASVLLSQTLWCAEDLSSASPRSFAIPLLIPLVLCVLQEDWKRSYLCLGLLALFYPAVALVGLGLYGVRGVTTADGRRRALTALAVVAICLVPTYVGSQTYGPTVTMAQAHLIPEFQPGGRHPFFREGLVAYWLGWLGGHSGLFKSSTFLPMTLVAALLWPLAPRLPLRRLVSADIRILWQLLGGALVWFIAAYATAFRLHMPNRYTGHTMTVVVPLLAAIVWLTLVERLLAPGRRSPMMALGLATLIGAALFFHYPLLLQDFPKANYKVGIQGPVYRYLQQQPLDTLVASLDYEADNLPNFAQRSVLMAPEYATPFHLGYYREIRQRAKELLIAHYTTEPPLFQGFIDRYGVDVWLVNRRAFEPAYLTEHRYWANNYGEALRSLDAIALDNSLLAQTADRCSQVTTEEFWLVETACVLSFAASGS